MASTIDKKDGNLVVINFEATKEELDASMQKAYSKNKGKFQVPGFRKGKVPYKLVLQYYGEGVLLEDAITRRILLWQESFTNAVAHQLVPDACIMTERA